MKTLLLTLATIAAGLTLIFLVSETHGDQGATIGQPGNPTIISSGLQIDDGTIEIYAMTAAGERGAALGAAHRIANQEVWVLDRGAATLPLQADIQVERVSSAAALTLSQAITNTVGHVNTTMALFDISVEVITVMNSSVSAGSTNDGTFLLYTLDKPGNTKGTFFGAVNTRTVGTAREEAWCLPPGVKFPIQTNFVAEWKTGSGAGNDPFNAVQPAHLEAAMKAYVTPLLAPTVDVVRIP